MDERRGAGTGDEDLRALLRTLHDAVLRLDPAGRVRHASDAAHDVLGLGDALLAEADWWERLRPRDDDGVPLPAPTAATTDTLVRITRPADGRPRLLSVRCDAAPDGGLFVAMRDCTDERRTRERLEAVALRDALTGLPNRAAALVALDEALERDAPFALLLVDVDAFRSVNTGLGQRAGNAALREIAARLRGVLPRAARAARFGGDDFLVLAPAEDEAAARGLAERIRDAFAAPFASADGLHLTASIGIAASDAAADAAGLVAAVEAALSRATAHGRGLVSVFDDELRRRTDDRRALIADLRAAIAGDALDVVYQPIVTLGRMGARVHGVEALARWHHPSRGPIPPSTFVALAEDAGLVRALGRRILARACREVAALRAELPRAAGRLELAVNVSARQVVSGSLEHDVHAALTASGLSADALALELTETALMDEAGPAVDTLESLRALGVRLVIDDFGTGYSSLTRLRRLPLDGLKIDRSFIAGLGQAAVDTAIVEAVLTMAAALGLPVVAEGVETREQARRLRALGCPRAQGYLHARPMALADLRSFLLDERRLQRAVPATR